MRAFRKTQPKWASNLQVPSIKTATPEILLGQKVQETDPWLVFWRDQGP